MHNEKKLSFTTEKKYIIADTSLQFNCITMPTQKESEMKHLLHKQYLLLTSIFY